MTSKEFMKHLQKIFEESEEVIRQARSAQDLLDDSYFMTDLRMLYDKVAMQAATAEILRRSK